MKIEKNMVRMFIEILPEKHVVEQLKARSVLGIEVCDMGKMAGMLRYYCPGSNRGIEEYIIVVSTQDPIDTKAFAVGHEIGHTFFASSVDPTFPSFGHCSVKKKPLILMSEEEQFCECFAGLWLEHRSNILEVLSLLETVSEKQSLFLQSRLKSREHLIKGM